MDLDLEERIRDLASTRSDGIPAKKRKELMAEVTTSLQTSASDREILANLKDLVCWSKFGYQRASSLYCTAILAETSSIEVRTTLVRSLCELLQRSANGKVVHDCQRALFYAFSNKTKDDDTTTAISTILTDIAQNESSISALALLPTPNWELFVKNTLNADKGVATALDMELCKYMLQSASVHPIGMQVNDWEQTVGPAVVLKLKAKPESVIDMVDGLTRHLNPAVVAQSALILDELLPVIMKHMKSPKEGVRIPASHIVEHLGKATVQAYQLPLGEESPQQMQIVAESAKKSLPKIVQALADTKTLNLLQQRQAVYMALDGIGKAVLAASANTTTPPPLSSDTVSAVLQGICTPLVKEAKTAVEARQQGLEALLCWMAISKLIDGGSNPGLEEALAFVRKPVTLKDGADSQFVLGKMVQQFHPKVLGSIVLDLWKQDAFVKGLEALMEAANKKHASSSSIPQVEGLLAVYLSLLHASESTKPKLSPVVDKAVSAGSLAKDKTSFVFGEASIKAIPTNPIVAQVLPQIILLHAKLGATAGATKFKIKSTSSVVKALASCITHPVRVGDQSPLESIDAVVCTVLDLAPMGEELVESLFLEVNRLSLAAYELRQSLNANRKAREDTASVSIKGKCSETGSHDGMDVNAVRRISRKLVSCQLSPSCLSKGMLLMHVGTSLRPNGKQRKALVVNLTDALKEVVSKNWEKLQEVLSPIADVVAEHASVACTSGEESREVSEILHAGALSLLTTLGSMASNYSPGVDDPEDEEMKPNVFASRLCIKEVAPRLGENVKASVAKIEALTDSDVHLYRTPLGTLFQEEKKSDSGNGKKSGGKGNKSEEEEWELQIKKELAKQKQTEDPAGAPLSAEDKKLVAQQDLQRKVLTTLMTSYYRCLAAIEGIARSDIEVGNACLPVLSEGVLALAVSECPATQFLQSLRDRSTTALTTLATCVYEIEETYARMMAMALITSYRKDENGDELPNNRKTTGPLTVKALPSPCEPAATTIFEMDEFQEELSGASFAFLFPVLKAALMGPRTTPGCEGALRVLERHTLLLVGEEKDPLVSTLRVDMVTSVLELLRHDRAQTFVDPTPYDTLVACYQTDDHDDATGPVLTTAELAPLLDERGALGPKNCRVAAMIALGSIATSHNKLVKSNPLIENRIWLNCFDGNDSIRTEARRTWGIVHDTPGLEEVANGIEMPPPSPLFAIPLLPHLHSSDQAIAQAAAEAFAHGMAAHPNLVFKNVQKLCSTYIDSCPQPGSESKPKASLPSLPTPAAAAPVVKKVAGVPASLKKKTVKKSALEVAGIGQPKKTKKKNSAVTAAFMKPKQERTLDQTALESQFKTGPPEQPAEKDTPEKIASRSGILNTLAALPPSKVKMEFDSIKLLTSFLVAYGIADPDEGVKNASRNALSDAIATYGSSDEVISFLLPHLDKVLKSGIADSDALGELSTAKISTKSDAIDRRKEGAVVALGSLALHLKGPENVSKTDATVDMLLTSLTTPNEAVQSSVADCLAKLMKKGSTQDRIEKILDDLMALCLDGENASIRRGGAYGIAAACKGSGIATLKKYGVVSKIEEACASGKATSKEGSLFAIELLCMRLGLLFEPYVIVLLPSLLKCFSDSSDHVRKAASNAVGLIMSKLSAHGVKLVMPAVLTAFNDSAWRTKQASIHMLGSMCHLAPKQLAQALPKVVPKLVEAFADTHPAVKSSAQAALDEITTVVRNPEIAALSSVLLKALTDPASNTLPALESLIATEFLHAIDAPSLALIVPILHRGMRDRAATTKRYGALITGNICTMINDPRDFVPYLSILVADLQSILLDPIPDVRSISAKAFGSLTRGLGEDTIPDLRPWLVDKLRAEDVTSAERSGAAQGLTEVLIASGTATAESVITEDILPLKNHPSPGTREGVLWMLTFLPPALGQSFTPMLDSCLPALISGLSDENEEVREIGIRAGRVIIRTHGRTQYSKILPILQDGMTDVDHRIRYSSLMLIGDLLSMIGGTTVLRTDGDTQDDIRRAEKAQAQITLTLGIEARNRVLSEVYLARSDLTAAVRQGAVQVWKTVVSVTARTLRQILPVLIPRVVSDLASGDVDKTEVAGHCLGDVVSKLGDSVMPEIIPVLGNTLRDGDISSRRGVCVGLAKAIIKSSNDQILRNFDLIVKVVQDALCDVDESVRQMASTCFQNLHVRVGNRALDEVVPALMVALESSESNDIRRTRALNGLTGILSLRSKELLPYIIPRLIQEPITTIHAKALGTIATVTGDSIYFHFKTVIPALVRDLANPIEDNERETEIRDCVKSLFGNSGEAGVNWLIGEIASKCANERAAIRRESCWMMETVITERKDLADFYEHNSTIIRELVARLNDDNTEVLQANNKALAALSKYVPAEVLVKEVEFMRNLIASMVSDARRRKGGVGDGEFLLPGLNMPKGLEPLLPIYQRGILYGTPSVREASADGLGEVISLTATKFLAGPLIIKMTGPLLRIVGDRNPSNVKIAILKTLGLILVKGGPALRAFVPQFQTTFVKALADPSRQVRVEAITALGLLMPLSTRVDPLLKELVAGSLGNNTSTETGGAVAVQTATLEALAVVLNEGGSKAKLPVSIPSALDAGKELLSHPDEAVREAAAKVCGAACGMLGAEKTTEAMEDIMENVDGSEAARHGIACAIRRVFSAKVSADLDDSISTSMFRIVLGYLQDDDSAVRNAACTAIGAAVGSAKNPSAALRSAESDLLSIMGSSKETIETHQAVAKGLCLALQLSEVPDKIEFFGLTLLNACLKMAMSGAQRVQFAFNDVLYLALDVKEGQGGLDKYSSMAMFEDARQMKGIYTKVLLKIKEVTILKD